MTDREIKPSKQLPRDIEERFNKKFTRKSKGLEDKGKYRDDWFVRETTSKELKQFLASELNLLHKEQEKEIKEIIGNNDVYLLPPGVKRVYGYSEDETTRIKAMCITNELLSLKKE